MPVDAPKAICPDVYTGLLRLVGSLAKLLTIESLEGRLKCFVLFCPVSLLLYYVLMINNSGKAKIVVVVYPPHGTVYK